MTLRETAIAAELGYCIYRTETDGNSSAKSKIEFNKTIATHS